MVYFNIQTQLSENMLSLAGWFCEQLIPSKLRTMREFAEQEIIIPDGPFKGRHFRCDRQPFSGLLFDAFDKAKQMGWNKFATTGPSQSGKTLCGYVIPVMYHLFEYEETVILGVPDMKMADNKWEKDILPVIKASRYRHLLPSTGQGSHGGSIKDSITFRNNATLKFMSGGSGGVLGDKARAGYTTRILAITETDGMDESGIASREADKITQMIARTRAYGDQRVIYMECTVSVESGRIWTEYQNGTCSKILLLCPHCESRVTPEREHLFGWQNADTVVEAKENAAFNCPECGAQWSEKDRLSANQNAKLLHKGQHVDEDTGEIVGEPVATDTLGFRYSAVNNMFVSSGNIGADEWSTQRAIDEDNADKEMKQFVWAMPYEPPETNLTSLDAREIVLRITNDFRGVVPKNTQLLTLGIDMGQYLCHWILTAWRGENGSSPHVVDYGKLEVASQQFGVEKAMLMALREFRDQFIEPGWSTKGGTTSSPSQVWIDARWKPDVVYTFVKETNGPGTRGIYGRYRAAFGFGTGQNMHKYSKPRKKTKTIIKVGEGFHITYLSTSKIWRADVDVDHWKSFLHQRLITPIDQSGSMTLFRAQPNDHIALAKHFTAERQVEEYIPRKGTVIKFETINRNNHWLDAGMLSCVAASFAGIRIISHTNSPPQNQPQSSNWQKQQRRTTRRSITMPDGRPFSILDR